MNNRLKLILTRPLDDSLESFISFRKNSMSIKTKRNAQLTKEDLQSEWEKFWKYINERPNSKICINNSVN